MKLSYTILVFFLVSCTASKNSTSNEHADPVLKDVYKNAFLIGTAVNPLIVSGENKPLQEIVLKQFNCISPENVMKAAVINPQPNVFNFKPADDFVAFGEQNKMFIIGHTLVWHNQCPAWFFTNADGKPNSKQEQIERLRQHIQTVAGRYAGRVNGWDVVNEVIDDEGNYRPTSWVKAIGDGDTLVAYAFRFAAQYAPNTELYYNDFNTWKPGKRAGIVRMVKKLQQQGIRIDGIGMQGHWGLTYPDKQNIEASIDAYADCGVKVMITELDVDVLPATHEGPTADPALASKQSIEEARKAFPDPYRQGLPDSVQEQLTKRYADLFSIFYSRRNKLSRVTFWGVHDGMSWKNNFPIRGRINYPLLWDRQLRPKPAFKAVVSVPAD